jgi:hypothetical protein
MRLGTSIVLIALGAILRFAVHVNAKGFSIHTIGLVLMLVGILGLILSVLWMTIWTNRTPRTAYVRRDIRDVPVSRDRDGY